MDSAAIITAFFLSYQRGNHHPLYRGKTDNTMAKREKGQNGKQRSTKHTHKIKDRVTRTPLKTGVNCGRVSSSCSTRGTRRVNLVKNPMISHE
jgi:hypothetical protein